MVVRLKAAGALWLILAGYKDHAQLHNDVPNNLQSCASTNFFHTASTPADINSALQAMFEQAVSTAHITN